MSQDNYTEMFREYAERMKEIRLLSTPGLDEIEDAGEYGHILVENFSKIGKLAAENRRIINEILKPMLSAWTRRPIRQAGATTGGKASRSMSRKSGKARERITRRSLRTCSGGRKSGMTCPVFSASAGTGCTGTCIRS